MNSNSKDSINENPENFGSKALKWLNPLTWPSTLAMIFIAALVLIEMDWDKVVDEEDPE